MMATSKAFIIAAENLTRMAFSSASIALGLPIDSNDRRVAALRRAVHETVEARNAVLKMLEDQTSENE